MLRVNAGLGISTADGSVPGAELPHTAVKTQTSGKKRTTAEATRVRDLSASMS